MRLPFLNPLNKKTEITEQFKGLNQNAVGSDKEFSNMKNISLDDYPCMGARKKRGVSEKHLTAPKGFLFKNGLFYIDGTNAYYKDNNVFTVTDTEKIIVGIGAYICVFPDNKMYNTFTGELTELAAHLVPTGSVTFALLSSKSVYTKITLSGIGNLFKTGDNVTISGCTNTELNGTKIISDSDADYIVVTGVIDKEFTQSSGLSFDRKIPEFDFVCEKNNRLWGGSSKNHEIYACKVGDPKNWYNYETGADMAYAATIGSDGDFTAIAPYSSYVLFFKENCIHILRGDKPSNFTIYEKELPGVKADCHGSVCTIDETLYYVSHNGVYAFDGAVPQLISDSIKGNITEAVSGSYDSKLYISCKIDGVRTLLVYDPRLRSWVKEDDTIFRFSDTKDGMLYILNDNGDICPIYGDKDEVIDWELESCDQYGSSIDTKYISNIKLNLWMAIGSEVTVYLKCDDEPIWQRMSYIRSTANKTYLIPIIPKRCSKYRIKLSGKGAFKLYAVSRDIEGGSAYNGDIHKQYRR